NGLWRDWMAKEKLITLPDETLEMLVEAVSKVDLERITVQTLLAAVKETYPELVKEFEDLI
ncbi:MAG TPA: NAD(P)/FAD-dependent oxidoreductase, partial [Methanomassiliicoccaceae archaeon]|nr:NAD(P)/FAD-dependent oxidoreductase [Methanomassiliicoccaceae archaeon]